MISCRSSNSDVAYGMIVAGIGAVAIALGVFISLPLLTQIVLGLVALGAGMALIGGFKYFVRRA